MKGCPSPVLSVSLTEIGMTFGGVPVFRWNFVFFTKKTQNLLCQCPKLMWTISASHSPCSRVSNESNSMDHRLVQRLIATLRQRIAPWLGRDPVQEITCPSWTRFCRIWRRPSTDSRWIGSSILVRIMRQIDWESNNLNSLFQWRMVAWALPLDVPWTIQFRGLRWTVSWMSWVTRTMDSRFMRRSMGNLFIVSLKIGFIHKVTLHCRNNTLDSPTRHVKITVTETKTERTSGTPTPTIQREWRGVHWRWDVN